MTVPKVPDGHGGFTAVPVRVRGAFNWPTSPASDVPWNNTGDITAVMAANGTLPDGLIVNAQGQVQATKAMRANVLTRVTTSVAPAGSASQWIRTQLVVIGISLPDVRMCPNNGQVSVVLSTGGFPILLQPGDTIRVLTAAGGTYAQQGGGVLWVAGEIAGGGLRSRWSCCSTLRRRGLSRRRACAGTVRT